MAAVDVADGTAVCVVGEPVVVIMVAIAMPYKQRSSHGGRAQRGSHERKTVTTVVSATTMLLMEGKGK